MLKQGFLCGASAYTTFAYTDDIVNQFLIATDLVFNNLRKIIECGNILDQIKTVKHSTFKRLTGDYNEK